MRTRLLALALILPATAVANDWQTANWKVMGTEARVEYRVDEHTSNPVPALKAELERLNALLSPWVEDSELHRVNEKAAREPVAISDEFFSLLEDAQDYFELTGGAFDITFASAGHLYDYRNGKAPDEGRLRDARQVINAANLRLLPENRVRFDRPGMRMDLGGIAKGYAVDRCLAILRDHGVAHAWISLGGDSYVLGQRNGRPWQVGIRHPRDAGQSALSLPVSDVAVSTSGDYERAFVKNGQRIHHIINPDTGRSAGELASVTVIAQQGMDADALSTSIFVLGIEEGLALANRLKDVSAILIALDGQVHYSNDLAPGPD